MAARNSSKVTTPSSFLSARFNISLTNSGAPSGISSNATRPSPSLSNRWNIIPGPGGPAGSDCSGSAASTAPHRASAEPPQTSIDSIRFITWVSSNIELRVSPPKNKPWPAREFRCEPLSRFRRAPRPSLSQSAAARNARAPPSRSEQHHLSEGTQAGQADSVGASPAKTL
jgi:hypothetical protein